MEEFQNIKTFSQKVTFEIGHDEKIKNTATWTYVIYDIIYEGITGMFYKK